MTTVLIVRDVLAADGSRMQSQGIMIDAADLATYQGYGWRLPFDAPAIPQTAEQAYDGFTKSPADVNPWQFDWSEYLAVGETITASQWITTAGLTLSSQSATATTTSVWVSGGTSGATYLVTNRINTTTGQQFDWSFQVSIHQQ